MPPQKSNFSSY